MAEEALLQLSKAETTHAPQEHAPSPPKKRTEERRWAPEKSTSMGQNFRCDLRSCASNPVTSTWAQPWATLSPADSLLPPPTAVLLPEGW